MKSRRSFPATVAAPRLGERRSQCWWWLSLGLLLWTLPGCGYQFVGAAVALPPEVVSLGVGKIDNRSREYGLEKTLALALEREIAVRRQFRMSQDPAAADAVVSGTIRLLNTRPVAFNDADQAVQYEIVLVLDVALTRASDGKVLWQLRGFREIDEYSTSPSAVVTASSEFQRGTLDAVDINNPQFDSVQLAESLRRRALLRLVGQAVRDVYTQMVEDF